MKNLKYVLVMFVALTAAVSCSDENGDDENPIVGTWIVSESEDGIAVSIEATFNEDNKGNMLASINFGDETITENNDFTWSTSGNKLTMEMNGETEVSTYVIVGNKLTITDGEGMITILTRA